MPDRITVFEADATPPAGHPLCNGGVAPVSRVIAPLSARGVVVMPAGQDPVVLCSVDWVAISNASHDLWRERLAAAAATRPGRVSVHSTHPHDAPGSDLSSQRLFDGAGLEKAIFDPAFEEQVLERVCRSVSRSLDEARPVTHISLGKARVSRFASTRRLPGPDGKIAHVRYSSCREERVRALEEGLVDPFARVVGFWEGERPAAALAYYASHPQSFYGRGAVSPDTIGLARGLRDAAEPGALHVYFCGAGGNVAAGKYNDGSPLNRFRLAGRLADGLGRAWENSLKLPLGEGEITWREEEVVLPGAHRPGDLGALEALLENREADFRLRRAAGRKLAFARLLDGGRKHPVSCLRLGPAFILHLPGELFVEYQLAAQAMRPGEFVCLAAYGDCGPGYIGTAESYRQGGYECDPGRARVAPEVEAVLLAAIRKLLAR